MITPGKITVLLFMAIVVVYLVYFVVKYVNSGRSEHFTDLADRTVKLDDCQLYNMRQEVMNVFELYLQRKPSADEIKKYSALGNEQDILVAIIKDFNISTSDVEHKRTELNVMRKDVCAAKGADKTKEGFVGADVFDEEFVFDESDEPMQRMERVSIERIVRVTNNGSGADVKPFSGARESFANSDYKKAHSEPRVSIPLKMYEELKNKILEMHSEIEMLD